LGAFGFIGTIIAIFCQTSPSPLARDRHALPPLPVCFAPQCFAPGNGSTDQRFPARSDGGWHIERIGLVETVAVHSQCGFAGRIDVVAKLRSTGTWAVIDFKTQKMKQDKKGVYQAAFYETWPLQLMAYFKALNHAGDCTHKLEDIASVVINSVEPTPVQMKVWPREDHESLWQAFNHARELWSFIKSYRPQPTQAVLSA
jgi:hypothetical protein